MPILILSLLLGAVVALAGFLVWLILYLFRVRAHGKKTFRIAALAYVIALPLLLFIVLPLLFSALIANAGTRPRDLELTSTPTDFGRSYEEVSFPSRDGLTLSGWLMGGEPERPALIVSHGLFRSRQEVLERSCRLNELGYTCLLFDFRSHGKSQGKQVSLGYLERQDILGAAAYLQGHSFDPSEVAFCGVSMGAVAAILAARDASSDPLALIAESPFRSIRSTVARHTWLFLRLPGLPFADLFTWNLGRIAGFDPARADTAEALSELPDVPVLLIYGSEDERMPREVAEALFADVPGGRKELVFFESAGHGRAFETDPDRYLALVDGFLTP